MAERANELSLSCEGQGEGTHAFTPFTSFARSPSLRHPASVDAQTGPRDRCRTIAAQKDCCGRNLFDLHELLAGLALENDLRDDFLARQAIDPGLIVDLLLYQRRAHPAGTDCVAGDALTRGL